MTDIFKKTSRLRGMKLRDEFLCPITCEVMFDPVVATDGHTYERSAIEKWLRTSTKSPRGGDPISKNNLVSNLNLKKLIQDLIDEGGSGLYCQDVDDKMRLFDVFQQNVVVFECLGPPESDWDGHNFQVLPSGCIGGRKAGRPENGMDVIAFKEPTISRRHFEVNYDACTKEYSIKDLGSAGGTFVRIPYGQKRELHPGMMILIGKHQFTVSSIDQAKPYSPKQTSENRDKDQSRFDTDNKSSIISSLVHDAEDLIQLMEVKQDSSLSLCNGQEISDGLKLLSHRMNHLRMITNASSSSSSNAVNAPNDSDVVIASDAKIADSPFNSPLRKKQNVNYSVVESDEKNSDLNPCFARTLHSDAKLMLRNSVDYESDEDNLQDDLFAKKCTLTCFAPDGSPIQGHAFTVDGEGATIGRKFGNKIPLYIVQEIHNNTDGTDAEPNKDHQLDENGVPVNSKIVNLDVAVSFEHAQITMDPITGKFYIHDGTATKPSTNGTWVRLSGPFQPSPPYLLSTGAELLIGTVRFNIRESVVIQEKNVQTPNNNSNSNVKTVDNVDKT